MTASPPGDRSLTWWPILGAAVIAIIGVTVILVVGSGKDDRTGLKTDSDGALTCPATFDQRAVTGVKTAPRAWVPVRPTGVDGNAALVPDAKPQHVTVCRYSEGSSTLATSTELQLGGTKVLTKGQTAMTKSLSAAPRTAENTATCAGPTASYLVGFVFPTGAEWVSVPGTACQAVTNGVYDTSADLQQQVAAAFSTGTWS